MRRFSDFSSWCLIQVTDVFREKNTEQDTRVLRGDTLCTHKGTHTTGSTLAPGYTDEGAPLPQFKTPFPECAPFLAATHSLGACPTLGGTTPAFTTGMIQTSLEGRLRPRPNHCTSLFLHLESQVSNTQRLLRGLKEQPHVVVIIIFYNWALAQCLILT